MTNHFIVTCLCICFFMGLPTEGASEVKQTPQVTIMGFYTGMGFEEFEALATSKYNLREKYTTYGHFVGGGTCESIQVSLEWWFEPADEHFKKRGKLARMNVSYDDYDKLRSGPLGPG